jgi:hypothetical protein
MGIKVRECLEMHSLVYVAGHWNRIGQQELDYYFQINTVNSQVLLECS